MDKNYQFFLKENMDSYIGEWVAICSQKIVFHGKDVKKVFEEAKNKCQKEGKERPLIIRVPDKEAMIFYF